MRSNVGITTSLTIRCGPFARSIVTGSTSIRGLHIDDLDCVLHEWLGLPVDTVVLPEIVHLHLASPKDVMDTPWTIGDKTFETFGSADR